MAQIESTPPSVQWKCRGSVTAAEDIESTACVRGGIKVHWETDSRCVFSLLEGKPYNYLQARGVVESESSSDGGAPETDV